MAQRTVSVTLVANIGSFVSSMHAAGASVSGLGKLAAGALGAAGVVGGLAAAVNAASEFESAMSGVSAATMATSAVLGELRDAALEAGAQTQYSATEAADAIREMAKAGISAEDIMSGGLTGALSLAAAGQLDVAQAAEIASVAMTQFNLAGEDLPHVADLLAAGAGKAMGEVSDLGAALNQSGLVAAAAGVSIEETTGILAAFASAGLIGSDAGTSLKTAIQRLQAPSNEAAGVMEDLGISMYDANGQFVGMEALAGQLRDGMSGLTPAVRDAAMATIFGSDAVRAANVLYSEGSEGIADWTAAVNDSGYAAEQAAILNDNLAGDVERLGGAWDTLLIQLGSGSQGPLRNMTQGLTELLDVVGETAESAGALAAELRDRLAPFFENIADVGADVWAVLTDIADTFAPIISGLGQVAAGAVIAALNILSEALSAISGFLADNTELAMTLATVLLVSLAGGMAAVTTAFWAFIGTPVVLFITGPLLGAFAGLATFLTGGFSAAVATAGAALSTLLAKAGPILAIYAVFNFASALSDMGEATDEASAKVDDLFRTLGRQETNSDRFATLSAGINNFKDQIGDLQAAVDKYEESNFWEKLWGGLAAGMDERDDNLAAIEELKEGLADAEAELDKIKETAESVGDTLGITADEVVALADAHGIDLTDGVNAALGPIAGVMAAMQQEEQAARGAGAGTEAFARETELAREQVDQAKQAIDDFKLSLDILTGAHVSMIQVETALGDALRAAEGAIEGLEGSVLNADGTLNTYSESGSRVSDVLLGIRESGHQLIATMIEQGETAEDVIAADAQLRESFIRSAGQMGISREAAERLADEILGIPSERETEIRADTTEASRRIGGIQGQLDGLQDKTVTITTVYRGEGAAPALNGPAVPRLAFGGPVPGFSPHDRADNVPIMATAGEFMQPRGAVRKYGMTFMDAVRAGRFPIELARGYAAGGPIVRIDLDRSGINQTAAALAAARDQTRYVDPPAGSLGSGGIGGDWTSIYNYVKARVPQARVNSAYRPGDPGYHGRGKAVDFGYGTGPGGAGSAGLALINRVLHDGIGSNLAELIYDGIGDDRPDLKNGRPLTYSAATRAEHTNHVHAAVYDQGGWLQPGLTMAYNGTGSPERVLTSREFSGGGGGGGWSGGSGPNLVGITIQGEVTVGGDGIATIAGRVVEQKFSSGTRRLAAAGVRG